ncbi:MAG: hypothetical protein U1D67_02285, partial [Dehalococcoidia bacterium]|nr:hypothetical protein [Dehalococcoidia bacterium]
GSRRSAAGSIQGPVELKDGLTATASIVINSKQDVVLVPNRALVRKGQNQLVQVLVNGQKVDRPVKVGLVNDRVTEITEGLEAGESVVIQTPTSSTTQQGLPGGAQRMIGGIGR